MEKGSTIYKKFKLKKLIIYIDYKCDYAINKEKKIKRCFHFAFLMSLFIKTIDKIWKIVKQKFLNMEIIEL